MRYSRTMPYYSGRSSVITALAVAGAFTASLLGTAPSADAAAITFTASGTGSSGPLAASAQFTTSAGQIQIVLSNTLAANVISSAGQAVSDLIFTLSNPVGTLGTTSATGQQGNISASNVVTYVAGSPGRFIGVGGGTFSATGSTITLEAIGGGRASEMIAPFVANGGTFSNLNAGFNNFIPYTIGPATFTLALSGITANTTVTSANFSFGTGPDTSLPGTPGTPTPPVPEPASLALLGGALVGFGLLRYRTQV